MVGIVLFVVVSVLAAIFLKGQYDEQKEDLLNYLPPIPKIEEARPITIRIGADGTPSIDGKAVNIAHLAEELGNLKYPDESLHVILKSGENTPKSVVSEVLDACAKAGIDDVSFTSQPATDAP